MVFALPAALGAVLDEGPRAVLETAAQVGEQLPRLEGRPGSWSCSFEGHRCRSSPQTGCGGLQAEEAALRKQLLTHYGIEIGGGLGAYAGKLWRIGLMGHTARAQRHAVAGGAGRTLLDR
ncbi:MAG: hypothetical protein R2749_06275 [Acidimicrobiales bacterium]